MELSVRTVRKEGVTNSSWALHRELPDGRSDENPVHGLVTTFVKSPGTYALKLSVSEPAPNAEMEVAVRIGAEPESRHSLRPIPPMTIYTWRIIVR